MGIPFQKQFVFVASSEEEWDDEIDLRTIIRRIKIGDREGEGRSTPFYRFDDIRLDRNVSMKARMETDTAFARTVQLAWMDGAMSSKAKPNTCDVIDYMLPLLEKFRARGGNPIFLRCPSDGPFLEHEKERLPRDSTWEILLFETRTPGIHFDDYEQLQDLEIPGWSHLSAPAARYFTKELVSILQEEGLLSNPKSK